MSKKIILGIFLLLSGLSVQAADSLNVRTVGSWPYGNTYSAVTCSIGGHQIAVIGNGGGIMTANIDTPSCPRWLGEVTIGGFPTNQLRHPRNVKVYGNYAYLSLAESGMGIVDISDPENPVICSQTQVGGYIVDLAVNGNYAYAADDSVGLRIYNIEDPYNPIDIGLVPNTVGCLSLAIKDTFLFISAMDWWAGYTMVAAYNISQPENPVMLDSLSNYSGGSIVIDDNYIYSGGFLDIIDIGDPANLILVNNLFISSNGKIAIQDTLVFCPQVSGGAVYIISIADPNNPYIITTYGATGYARDVYQDKGLLYVSEDMGGLRIIDISLPFSPFEIGAFNSPSPVYGNNVMLAKDDILYCPAGDLYSLDVSDPTAPYTIKWGKALGKTHAVALKDSIILTIDDACGLKTYLLDTSKYLLPIDSANVSGTYTYSWDIYWLDSLALVISSDSLFIFKISPSGNCQRLGQRLLTSDPGEPVSISAAGQYAYVTAGRYGLYVVNISDPENPVILDSIDIGMVWDQSIKGDKLFLANHSNGLRIMDIAIPDSPKVICTYDSIKCAMSLAIDSSFAYVAGDSAGLRIINISNPANPFETGFYAMETVSFPLNNRAVGVAVENGNIFVSHYASGLKVYQYYGPSGIACDKPEKTEKPLTLLLKDAYPNPARSKTNISYQLPNKTEVRVNLYNVAGQLVRSLNLGAQQPGYYNIPLKTDKLSSGVYFYKLTAGNKSQTRKFVVLK